jgi:uracil phosphoribosyltransferase
MLRAADQAYVVVGKERERSKTMDNELASAITSIDFRLKARQILLGRPNKDEHQHLLPSPRIDMHRLPIVSLRDAEIKEMLAPYFMHATSKSAAQLLKTPLRDSKNYGHDLRSAHERVGFYLATEYVSEMLGVESYTIPHVQNKETEGHRLLHEDRTLIVPLIRGGEPMAFGVSSAFKTAIFEHAKKPEDLTRQLVRDSHAIILVDSVVNSGKSILEFVNGLRGGFGFVGQIVVVTGVVQEGAVAGGPFAEMLRRDRRVRLLALRVSENKYTGRGGTDTGHRLFNTVMLD